MNWKKLLYYFRYYFIVIVILAVVLFFVGFKKDTVYVRTNQECLTAERVFDYAGVLDEEEEKKLRELIAQKELETGCDIVLVTLNESLEEYAKGYEDQLGYIDPSRYVMVFADNFYDENNFGFDKVHGDGVLLLDNWYREADGKVYSWMSTCGRAESAFSSGMIDNLLNDALEYVDSDPYGAYTDYVNLFARRMTPEKVPIPAWAMVGVAGMFTFFYVVAHLSQNRGRRTVNEKTYLAAGGRPRMKCKEDVFLRKSVSSRKIETDSGRSSGGGGGGGHHISSGGVSHGGGGHSR